MALPDTIVGFHLPILRLSGAGSCLALLGMASYGMGYEFKDFERVAHLSSNGPLRERIENVYSRHNKAGIVIMAVSAAIFVAGIVLLTLGATLYPLEREEIASNIPGQIAQTRAANAQPKINQPAILAGIGAALIVGGMSYGAFRFNSTENWGWIASSIYSLGWIALAFAGAMNNKAIDSLVLNRVAWNLCGSALVIAGTLLFPWQLENNYISGPSWVLAAIGYACFTIGTSYLTSAPTTL